MRDLINAVVVISLVLLAGTILVFMVSLVIKGVS